MPAIEILIARVNAFLYFSRSIVLVFAIFLPRHEVGIGQGDYFSGIRYIYAYTGERFSEPGQEHVPVKEGARVFCFVFFSSNLGRLRRLRLEFRGWRLGPGSCGRNLAASQLLSPRSSHT